MRKHEGGNGEGDEWDPFGFLVFYEPISGPKNQRIESHGPKFVHGSPDVKIYGVIWGVSIEKS